MNLLTAICEWVAVIIRPHTIPETRESLNAQIQHLQSERDLYYQLIYAVARVFPGETRHQTALRYIREAEDFCQRGEPASEEKV